MQNLFLENYQNVGYRDFKHPKRQWYSNKKESWFKIRGID
jgi:hypothetical protein